MKDFLEFYLKNDVLKHILYARALRAYLKSADGARAGQQLFDGFMNFSKNLTVFVKTEKEEKCEEDIEYSILDAQHKQICRARVGRTTRALSATLICTTFSYFLRYIKILYKQKDETTLLKYSACEHILVKKQENKKELKQKSEALKEENAALQAQLAALQAQLAALRNK